MDELKLVSFFMLASLVKFGYCFPSRPLSGTYSSTLSHFDITNYGFHIAAATFLVDQGLANNLPTAIDDYFKKDPDNYEVFRSMIDEVVAANNDLQRLKESEAKYSVNGEQIQAAHDFIVKTREEIKQLLKEPKSDTLRALLREKTGQCLYVIQSFYSSTNWVEMKGDVPYLDFGVPNKPLMAVAASDTATCRDCGRSGRFTVDSCKSSLLVTNQLTSGYVSEQDIKKPVITEYIGSTKGKCSHGGNRDPMSQTITAVGGINKETLDETESPRHDLHFQAARAAQYATSHFLIGEGGVLEDMGNETFMWTYSLVLRSSMSLTFIIDVSGSMGDDISAVKAKSIEMATNVQNTAHEPDNYVLVTFNDPDSLQQSWVTTDYNVMLGLLTNISVSGGGDCPEYAMSGILKGIELSNPGSDLLVFTDADAKDCARKDEVEEAAETKNMKIKFILTGNCGGLPCGVRKRSTKNGAYNEQSINIEHQTRPRRKRAISSIYQSIADATGGAAFETTKDQISVVIDKIIEDSFPSSKVIIQTFSQPHSAVDQRPVFVDEDVKVLRIAVTGALGTTEVDLKNPSGTLQSYDGTIATRTYSSNVVKISIKDPADGQWNLIRQTKRNWEVNVTAEAGMDINFLLIETDEKGYAFQTKGNPVAGAIYTLFVTVNNKISNSSSTSVVLLNKDGSEQVAVPVTLTTTPTATFAGINFTMQSTAFGIQLKGLDRNNNTFMRSSWKEVVPVTVNLQLHQVLGQLHTGEAHSLSYTVTNSGESDETFEVTFVDDKGYYASVVNKRNHNILASQSVTDNFKITGTVDLQIVEYKISVLKSGSSTILQSLSNRIVFTTKVHPTCSVISMTGNCTVPVDCSTVTWSASATFVYSGVKLQNIYLTNADTDVKLVHDNFTLSGSPNNVNITGTCCSPTVYVNAVDEDNYDARCHFHFGDPYTLVLPEPPSTTSTTTTTTEPTTTTTEPTTTTTEPMTTTTEPTTTTTEPTTTTTEPTTTTTEPTTTTTEPTTTTTEPTTTITEPTTTTTEPTTTTTEPMTTTTEPTTTTTEPTTTTTEPTTTTTEPTTTTTEPTTTTTEPTTTTTEPTTTTTEPTTTTTEPTTTTTEPTTTTTELMTTTTEPTTTTTEPTTTTTEPTTTTTEPTTTTSEPTTTTTEPTTTTTEPTTTTTEPTTTTTEPTTTTTEPTTTTTEPTTTTTEPTTTTTEPTTTTTESTTTTTEPTTTTTATATQPVSTTPKSTKNPLQSTAANTESVVSASSKQPFVAFVSGISTVSAVLLIVMAIGILYALKKARQSSELLKQRKKHPRRTDQKDDKSSIDDSDIFTSPFSHLPQQFQLPRPKIVYQSSLQPSPWFKTDNFY